VRARERQHLQLRCLLAAQGSIVCCVAAAAKGLADMRAHAGVCTTLRKQAAAGNERVCLLVHCNAVMRPTAKQSAKQSVPTGPLASGAPLHMPAPNRNPLTDTHLAVLTCSYLGR
jgi:hypothetical protein